MVPTRRLGLGGVAAKVLHLGSLLQSSGSSRKLADGGNTRRPYQVPDFAQLCDQDKCSVHILLNDDVCRYALDFFRGLSA